MKIQVYNEREDKSHELDVNSIDEILKQLNINLEEVIIVKNKQVVTKDTKLEDNDKIELLSVVSGG